MTFRVRAAVAVVAAVVLCASVSSAVDRSTLGRMLLAKYEPGARETDGELMTMKHENGWTFNYEVSA